MPPCRLLTPHPEGKSEPVAKASAERQIWVVHPGSFVARFGMGRLVPAVDRRAPACLAGVLTDSKRNLPNQPELARPVEGLGAVPCAELAVDVAGVALDGAHGDVEIPCCL